MQVTFVYILCRTKRSWLAPEAFDEKDDRLTEAAGELRSVAIQRSTFTPHTDRFSRSRRTRIL